MKNWHLLTLIIHGKKASLYTGNIHIFHSALSGVIKDEYL